MASLREQLYLSLSVLLSSVMVAVLAYCFGMRWGPVQVLLHYAARPCGLATRQFFNCGEDYENEVKHVGDGPGLQTPTLTRM